MQYSQYFRISVPGGVTLALLALMGTSVLAASPKTTGGMGVKPQGSSCPANAPIKGNIRHGHKVYHLPSSANYQQVKPEACFPSATAAQQAGFHAPKTSSQTTH